MEKAKTFKIALLQMKMQLQKIKNIAKAKNVGFLVHM